MENSCRHEDMENVCRHENMEHVNKHENMEHVNGHENYQRVITILVKKTRQKKAWRKKLYYNLI
jgi:hypothetical protein